MSTTYWCFLKTCVLVLYTLPKTTELNTAVCTSFASLVETPKQEKQTRLGIAIPTEY